MLAYLHVKGYKSLRNIELRIPKLTVLYGPNAAGKSNFLDALQSLSRLATSRTLNDALSDPLGKYLMRGFPIESFSLPPSGLPGLLHMPAASFVITAELLIKSERYRYRVEIGIQPSSGSLTVRDEYLAILDRKGQPKGQARIEQVGGNLIFRSRASPGRPRQEKLGLNYTLLSDARLGSTEYRIIEICRREFSEWRTYYLDPRVAMRTAKPPAEVDDIGALGEDLGPFLYRLRAEHPRSFSALSRAVRSIIPSVDRIDVDLDEKRGTTSIIVKQDNIDFSSRILSEGTLRVIALCAIAVNPWRSSLIAFEEPENGVHPRRIELIAELLASMIDRPAPTQVVVTTHSPIFCNEVLRKARDRPNDIGLFRVTRGNDGTRIVRFPTTGPLFDDQEIKDGLNAQADDGLFESVIMRGLIDAE